MVPTCRPEKAARFVSGIFFRDWFANARAHARIAADP
jgi:hypothetical protein